MRSRHPVEGTTMNVLLTGTGIAIVIGGLILLFNRRLRQSLTAAKEPIVHSLAEHHLIGAEIKIPTQRGRQLDGWLLTGQRERNPQVVVITHGWGANRELMLPLARPLQAAGFHVLLFDARSHGSSDNDNFSSMPRFAEDIDAALNWIRMQAQFSIASVSLIGHSVGAAATLLATSRRDDIACVVSLAAFAHPEDMMRRWLESKKLPYFPLGWYVLNYVQWVIGYRFDAIAPIHTIKSISCPVLIMHGSDDSTIPPADAKRIFEQGNQEINRLLILPGEHDATDEIEQHIHEPISFIESTKLSTNHPH